jgi:hypothetical protein
MPWVQQFSKLGSVGVLKRCCTTNKGRIRVAGASAKTPMQTFLDAVPMAKEKMIAA